MSISGLVMVFCRQIWRTEGQVREVRLADFKGVLGRKMLTGTKSNEVLECVPKVAPST